MAEGKGEKPLDGKPFDQANIHERPIMQREDEDYFEVVNRMIYLMRGTRHFLAPTRWNALFKIRNPCKSEIIQESYRPVWMQNHEETTNQIENIPSSTKPDLTLTLHLDERRTKGSEQLDAHIESHVNTNLLAMPSVMRCVSDPRAFPDGEEFRDRLRKQLVVVMIVGGKLDQMGGLLINEGFTTLLLPQVQAITREPSWK